MIIKAKVLPPEIAAAYAWSDNKEGWELDFSEDWYDGKPINRVDHDWLSVHSIPLEALFRFRAIYRDKEREWHGSWMEVYDGIFIVTET